MNVAHVYKFLSFFCWALFTYTSHFFAKQYFSSTSISFTTEKVIFLTSLQVGCGAILYVIMKLRNRHGGGLVLDYRIVLLGACHSYGMLMTNSSMAQTTASLTHLVKMSEPFYTTIIMAIMGKISFNCKIIFIMIIILATAIGSEPISDAHSSLIGIGFALVSNLCYALRNTGTKYFYSEESSKSATTLEGFAALSFGGFLSLVPTWIGSCLLGYDNYPFLLTSSNNQINYFLIISSISHALYNIISLTIILSFFNPVQHAMLNVGKRTSIVLVFYIFSQRPFTILNLISAILCLIVSIVGVQVMSIKKHDESNDKSEEIGWKSLVSGIFILILSLSSISWTVSSFRTSVPLARENWLQCIDDIQQNIIGKLSDHLTKPALLNHPTPLLLIDPAYGGNVGDNFIAYGELVLMERMGYLNHTECHIIQSQGLSKWCNNFTHVPDGGLAWWHGGGNWGDLWDRKALTLRRMRSFIQLTKKGKTVIGMPQSFHYQNKVNQTGDATNWMADIAAEYATAESKAKMVLTWRQNESYDQAASLYPLVDNRLVPDIAFMIGPVEETFTWSLNKTNADLIFLLRNDKESRHMGKRNVDKLRQIIDSNDETRGLSFEMVDWWDRGRFFDKTVNEPGPELKYKVLDEGKFDYQYMFKSSIAMFTGGKVLITDRLHSSIFAFLMHKPHVYVDQMYGKIRKTREVAFEVSDKCKDREEMKFDEAENIEEAVVKAARMLRDKKFWVE